LVQSVLFTLTQVIIPISVPVAAGALLVRFMRLEIKPLLTVVLYILSPAMVFTNLTAVQITFAELAGVAAFFVINASLMWTVSFTAGKAFRLPDSERAGLALMSVLTNAVNYGLPLVQLAYGQAGMEKASVFVVFMLIFTNTFGVYFAARSNFSVRQAIMAVFKLPAIYAVVLAVTLRFAGLSLPSGIFKGVSMISQAYSPVMLMVLGAQMARVKTVALDSGSDVAFWSGLTVRMIVSPLVAFAVLSVLGIKGLLFPTLLILASMPVAVNAGLLAENFNAAPDVVSKCVLWTTLSSFIVLPVLISLISMI